MVTGDRTFTIFQDVDGIEFGQHWPSRLDEALASARFLIPVLSPSFFTERAVPGRAGEVLELERHAGRRDLILPLYFVTASVLERPALRVADPLAQRSTSDNGATGGRTPIRRLIIQTTSVPLPSWPR